MADVTPVPPAGGTPDPNPAPAPPGPAPKGPENQVTPEQIAELTRRLDGISGVVRGLKEQNHPPTPQPNDPPKPPVTPEPPANQTPAQIELQKRLDALEERDKKVQARARRNLMREAAQAAGVPADRIGHLVKLHGIDLAERLSLSEDMDSLTVSDASGLDQPSPYNGFLEAFLKTDSGAMFKAPKAASGAPGMSGSENIGPDGRHRFSSMSYQQIMASAGSMQYMKDFPEEFAAKKAAAFAKPSNERTRA